LDGKRLRVRLESSCTSWRFCLSPLAEVRAAHEVAHVSMPVSRAEIKSRDGRTDEASTPAARKRPGLLIAGRTGALTWSFHRYQLLDDRSLLFVWIRYDAIRAKQ
jgi:hypothetical protein